MWNEALNVKMWKCYRKLLVDATSRRDKRARLHELLLYVYEEQIFPSVKLFFLYIHIHIHMYVYSLFMKLFRRKFIQYTSYAFRWLKILYEITIIKLYEYEYQINKNNTP